MATPEEFDSLAKRVEALEKLIEESDIKVPTWFRDQLRETVKTFEGDIVA